MSALKSRQCEACNADARRLTESEIDELLPQLPDWQVIAIDSIQGIRRRFIFANFKDALAFTNRVGTLAEGNNHHPQIITEWGSVTVSWWTHKINGLHLNDVILAAKTSELFNA